MPVKAAALLLDILLDFLSHRWRECGRGKNPFDDSGGGTGTRYGGQTRSYRNICLEPRCEVVMRSASVLKKTHRRKKGCKPSRKYRSIASAEYERALEKTKYGSLGPASPVRQIDPATGEVVATVEPIKTVT